MPRRLPLLAVALALAWLVLPVPDAPGQAKKARAVHFCFWNVENLFDDREDPRLQGVDRAFDRWFATNKEALKHKLTKVGDVLQEMNEGKGPDVIALAEVESQRAADLVVQELNRRFGARKQLHYHTAVYRDPKGLRSIATAVITRLKVASAKTRLLGRMQRILKVPVEAEGRELIVVASHWTSRVSDKAGTGRANYAKVIHADFAREYRANPKVDYLVCGDFNDDPDEKSVTESLMATGDVKKALDEKAGAVFFNPFAVMWKNDRKNGSHYFRGTAHLFDQICLSPGLLDGEGWAYVDRSAKIVRRIEFRGRPDRFGGPEDKRPWRNRGASDHFPVTATFRVSP
jgi:endonuclease/exonuclease/phosphatase family metal-dependent hydrolase